MMEDKYKISIDELCTKSSYQFSCFVENVVEYNKNNDITSEEYDKLISMLNSLYNTYNIHSLGELLYNIVNMKIPNDNQITILVRITVRNKGYPFKWIEHLKLNGVTLTKKHLDDLLEVGYIDFDCPELKSNDDKIKKKYLLSIFSKLSFDKLITMFSVKNNIYIQEKLKNIINFDNDYFEFFNDALNTKLKSIIIKKYNWNIGENLNKFFNMIIAAGYVCEHHGLKTLIKNRINNPLLFQDYSNIIKQFINNNIYPSNELLFDFLNTGEHVLCGLQLEIVDELLKKGLHIDNNILNIMNVKLYKIKGSYDILYLNIFNNLKNNFVPTYDTLLFACKTNNTVLLDFCAKKNIEPDMECLHTACRGYNSTNVQKLIDMKLVVDDKCLHECLSQKEPSSNILNVIVNAGINIPDNYLEYLILNNISIPEKCTVTENTIFKICHKYTLPMTRYLPSTFTKSKKYRLYKMVSDKTNKFTLDSVKAYMKKENIDFDDECYDEILIKYSVLVLFKNGRRGNVLKNACSVNNDVTNYHKILCDAIETKKYIVTAEAIARCSDNLYRMRLMNHYGFVRK